MKCNLCSKNLPVLFVTRVLRKYDVRYYCCDDCGYVQTEKPYWLGESYSESINKSDTGLVARNIVFSKIASVLLLMRFDTGAVYVDYGGGLGMFTRLMRDNGYDFFTTDPYTKNALARGFDYQGGIAEMLTSFECFEHFEQPLENIEKMLRISRNILFTTWLLPYPVPKVEDWWYYGTEHGQHISFYSKKTIVKIAAKFNLKAVSFRNLHLITEKNISPIELAFAYISGRLNMHIVGSIFLKSKTMSDSNRLSGEVDNE